MIEHEKETLRKIEEVILRIKESLDNRCMFNIAFSFFQSYDFAPPIEV